MTEAQAEPQLTTLRGATLAEVVARDGVEWAVFTLPSLSGARLTVPTSCVRGAWPVEVGSRVDLEYRTNDTAAGARCGFQSVTVLGFQSVTVLAG